MLKLTSNGNQSKIEVLIHTDVIRKLYFSYIIHTVQPNRTLCKDTSHQFWTARGVTRN